MKIIIMNKEKSIRDFFKKDVLAFRELIKSIGISQKNEYTDREVQLMISFVNMSEKTKISFLDYQKELKLDSVSDSTLEDKIKSRRKCS